MNEKQLQNYLNIEQEVESVNARKYNVNTRKIYKRYILKFARILIENNVYISSIRNINTQHLKDYAFIEMEKGRKIPTIIAELRGVTFYHQFLNRNISKCRRQHLLDLRILQRYLEERGGVYEN